MIWSFSVRERPNGQFNRALLTDQFANLTTLERAVPSVTSL